MTTLQKRILSSVILAPLVIAAIAFGSWPFWAILLVAYAIGVYEWLNVSSKTDVDLPASLFGILYIAFGIVCFAVLREASMFVAFLLILAVWLSDVGAYAVGKTVGGPKMAPLISPNKTWAGLGGAVFGSMLVFLLAHYSGIFLAGIGMALAYGAVIAISGQIGDLLISLLKRRAGVKDTGALIPGHGGLLDRIDSLLLAAPAFFFAIKVAGAFQ